MANEVFKNDASITLDWADISGATTYHVQVNTSPDFSAVMTAEDAALAVSTKSFTDASVNNAKRYWRWRYSLDNAATWSAWSEVGSYWLNNLSTGDVSLATDKWAFFDPSNLTDLYTLPVFPIYSVQKNLIARLKTRNRLATLLTEYITVKDAISFHYGNDCWIDHEQMREFYRFHTEIKTFFVATMKSNGVDVVPNIWKAQFSADPGLTMIAAGRQDIFVGDLTLEEV